MNKIKTPLIYHNPLLKDYLNNLSENLTFKKTFESYTEERYKASDIKQTLSYRTINSWDSAGMLITLPNRDSKWRKYSLVEIIWIYIIRELRSIGFSRKKILKLRDCIFPTLPNTNITNTKNFKQYILSVVAKRDVYLIVKPDGEGDLAIDIELLETERDNNNFPKTYTVISINKLCAEFTGNEEYNIKNQFLYIPTNQELNLLNEVKNTENLKEATLKVDGNKISRINYKKTLDTKAALTNVNNAIKSGGRKEIHINIEDGNVVYFEETDKK